MSKTYYDSTDRDSKAVQQWANKKESEARRKERKQSKKS